MDDTLYNWIFWHNGTDWYAIHRDSQLLFFCGRRNESKYFKHKDLNFVLEIIKDYEY